MLPSFEQLGFRPNIHPRIVVNMQTQSTCGTGRKKINIQWPVNGFVSPHFLYNAIWLYWKQLTCRLGGWFHCFHMQFSLTQVVMLFAINYCGMNMNILKIGPMYFMSYQIISCIPDDIFLSHKLKKNISSYSYINFVESFLCSTSSFLLGCSKKVKFCHWPQTTNRRHGP